VKGGVQIINCGTFASVDALLQQSANDNDAKGSIGGPMAAKASMDDTKSHWDQQGVGGARRLGSPTKDNNKDATSASAIFIIIPLAPSPRASLPALLNHDDNAIIVVVPLPPSGPKDKANYNFQCTRQLGLH
jgi:hypothetical protein